MMVLASPGVRVPKEFQPRDYITDADPVDVIDSAYYQRRIADGDLIEVDTVTTADKSKGAK